MRKTATLFFLLLSCSFYSQSILSYINYGTESEFYSKQPVTESTINYTFFNQSGVEKKKEITVYNADNKVQNELTYDENGKMIRRRFLQYDEKGNKIISKFENWIPAVGHTSESTHYIYDENNFLTGLIEKDSKNSIIRETTFINDDRGNPIELVINKKGRLEGKETAKYNYEANEVEISYFNSSNQMVSTQKSKISYKNEPGDIVSEYGDIIKSSSAKADITYDSYGNWTRMVNYRVVDGKMVKKSDFRRQIKYKKDK